MTDHTDNDDPKAEGFEIFMSEFVGESDRAAVILGAAKVEFLLGQIIEKYLLPSTSNSDELLEGDSPLSTFSSRIKLCHRLGIIDDQFARMLNIFRRLRNGFAHEVTHSTLTSGSARDRILALVEPFSESRVYQSLTRKVAKETDRPLSDPGVPFRACLAIFYMELSMIHDEIEPARRHFEEGIVESTEHSPVPNEQ